MHNALPITLKTLQERELKKNLDTWMDSGLTSLLLKELFETTQT